MLTSEEEKYLKTISKTKLVRIFPYDKKIKKIVKDITDKIKKSMPELDIKFIGAAALEISGQKDIDLYVLCPANKFPDYLQKMMRIFDIPTLMNKESIKWNFKKSGYNIELYLTDPDTSQMQRQLKVFEILKSNFKLLKEYENLKKLMNGKSCHSYQKAKYEFYNKILEKK